MMFQIFMNLFISINDPFQINIRHRDINIGSIIINQNFLYLLIERFLRFRRQVILIGLIWHGCGPIHITSIVGSSSSCSRGSIASSVFPNVISSWIRNGVISVVSTSFCRIIINFFIFFRISSGVIIFTFC